jgi:multicomponent Na+:H+ antiporter subunit D
MTFFGKTLIDDAALSADYWWLPTVLAIASGLTGAALLRVTGRVFLGWGTSEPLDPEGTESEEAGQTAASHEEGADIEAHPKVPLVLVAVPALLMFAAVVAGLVPDLIPGIERAAAHFRDHVAYATAVLAERTPVYKQVATSHVTATAWIYSLVSLTVATAGAAVGLRGRQVVPGGVGDALRAAHSGHVGDYVAWWTLGMAILGGLVLWAVAV